MTTATAPENSRRIGGPSPVIPKAPREDEPPKVWPVWALKLRQDYEARIAQLEDEKHELEMAIVNQNQATKALSIYGPTSLDEMASQVAISPRFAGLTPAEHKYVAGVGLASGLNPEFHLHAFKSGGKLTVVVDYKALIMSAYTRAIMLKERRMTREEMLSRGIPEQDVNDGSIGFVIEGYELDLMIKARKAGLEYEPKRGYGWWAAKKDEEEWTGPQGNRKKVKTGKRTDNDVPNGRDGEWVARKRAMRDLYNQFADLSLKIDKMMAGVNAQRNEEGDFVFSGDTIEGSYTVGDAVPADEPEQAMVEIPEWLRNPDSVARAEKFMADQGVTDEQVSAAFDVENWREAPITPEEFKAAVELIKARQGEIVEGDFTDDAPVAHQDAQHATEGDQPVSPPAKPPKGAKSGQSPKMCQNCGLSPAVSTPEGNDLCNDCAQAEANRKAARQ